MNDKQMLSFAEKVVERLIMQYQEYVALTNQIKTKENQKLVVAAKLSKKNSRNVLDVLRSVDKHPELRAISDEIELLKKDLQQVSDEMTFANPVIWMMYKYRAYKDASNEISTLHDFRKHCKPEGYICTQRYKFLNNHLINNNNVDLNDKKKFPDNMDLSMLYKSKIIIDLCADVEFMKYWKNYEYLRTDGKINKWLTGVIF